MKKSNNDNKLQIRNSTAEFLIFAYQSKGDGVEVRVQDGTIWLSQKNMATIFDTSSDNVGLHLKNIYLEKELSEKSTTEDFSVVHHQTAAEVSYYMADHKKENMGLTTWKNSPDGKYYKTDVANTAQLFY